MVQNQEQRILGYFIDEAKDHLNTIEQGLVNLQDTLADTEMINAVFRAAHSVKGGAAMLGFDSIQHTAHRLEDYFKILKENPTIKVDQKLEALLLKGFDTLQELINQLEASLSLPEDVVSDLMVQVEPVFNQLSQYLELLVQNAGGITNIETLQITRNEVTVTEKDELSPVFQSQVMQTLREMLQLFKQAETPQSRQELQECCQHLSRLGEQFNLSNWCKVCHNALAAIANRENNYRTLAPIVIKELKQAQELVLAGRADAITTTEQLKALASSNIRI